MPGAFASDFPFSSAFSRRAASTFLEVIVVVPRRAGRRREGTEAREKRHARNAEELSRQLRMTDGTGAREKICLSGAECAGAEAGFSGVRIPARFWLTSGLAGA